MKISTQQDSDKTQEKGSRDGAAGGEKKRSLGRFSRVRPSKDLIFDYKDVQTLKRFISEHGRIVPRRISRLNAHQQRQLTQELKRSRQLALIPYTERD